MPNNLVMGPIDSFDESKASCNYEKALPTQLQTNSLNNGRKITYNIKVGIELNNEGSNLEEDYHLNT